MTTFWSILVLGFFLGMRHATDSDHVVAVTTIVSRQRLNLPLTPFIGVRCAICNIRRDKDNGANCHDALMATKFRAY
jgi:hypothetical protein